MQIDPYLSPCIKLNCKWIKDLNINQITLNLITKEVGNNLQFMETGDYFLNKTPVAQTFRVTINKWDLLKLGGFFKEKDTINKTRRKPTEWEKIFINPLSDRELIFKIYKELKKLDIKISNNSIKKWSTDLNREFSTEETQKAK